MNANLPFRPDRFQGALTTSALGRFLTYRSAVDTTMELARRAAAEGAPHGTLILAETQTAGRGRKGRSFHSPPAGNLYFTFVLRLSAETQRLLPVAVPLAVCEAIREENIEARIKWPNDIWVGERKLCGMLIDAESGPGGITAFPGIGINANGDPALEPELAAIATSIRRETGEPVDRELLLARVCNRLEAALVASQADIVARYRALSLLLGRPVTVSPTNAAPYEATAEDIAADGSLVVLRDGSRETITAAEVSVRPVR
ncbi:MAG: biotin--[acetyl-CoA-carboxylase] ligase [Dehalococcoidia bacterium]|nr:biotin--[acetyl-CoA-carboxylase] ligase [Dehalococcoidia bacterium]